MVKIAKPDASPKALRNVVEPTGDPMLDEGRRRVGAFIDNLEDIRRDRLTEWSGRLLLASATLLGVLVALTEPSQCSPASRALLAASTILLSMASLASSIAAYYLMQTQPFRDLQSVYDSRRTLEENPFRSWSGPPLPGWLSGLIRCASVLFFLAIPCVAAAFLLSLFQSV